jgi:hypothetical protein
MCSVDHALYEIKTSRPEVYDQIYQALTRNVRVIVETNHVDSICRVHVIENQPRWSRNGVKFMTYTTDHDYRFYYLIAELTARSLSESEALIPSESELQQFFRDFLKEGLYEAHNFAMPWMEYFIIKLLPRISIRQHFNQVLETCRKFDSTIRTSSWDSTIAGRTYYAKYGDFLTRVLLLAQSYNDILIVDYVPTMPLDTYIQTTGSYWEIKSMYCLWYDEEDRNWAVLSEKDATSSHRPDLTTHRENWMATSYDETFLETPWITPPQHHLTMDGSLPLIKFNGFPLLVTTEFFHSLKAARQWLHGQIKLYYRPAIASLGIPAAAEEFRYRPGSNLRDFSSLTRTTFGLTSFDYTK